MARKATRAKIDIKPSMDGSLRRIAQREGGIKSNGEISRSWMQKKMKNPRTSASTKKKLNFAINAGNWNKGR